MQEDQNRRMGSVGRSTVSRGRGVRMQGPSFCRGRLVVGEFDYSIEDDL